ncbi:hypothetical protein KPL71_004204 [Citrus sinensis]|uniref:Uncharacterized protein n=1 Tax=Citrus sinensis TaxID=2711 RepID=A0ACB8N3H0_CITSI|nr:hypothetical protein KPL71_004204 [Citrus sinensis]
MCNPACPCLDDTDDDEDFEIMRRRRMRKKKPSTPKTPCRPYSSGPPDHLESDQPLPIYKKALRQLQRDSSFKPVPAQPKIKSCLMFSSFSQSYQESFPPLERHTDPQTKLVSQPYVQSPITTSGAPEAPKQYEAVLNWQTQNASAQNQAILNRISELDIDLRTMINNRIWGPKFNKKEAEIRQLKAELARIDADKAQPSLFTKTQSIPMPAPLFTSYQPFYTPSKQSTYDQFFGLSHLHNIPSVPPPKTTSPKRSKSKVKISKPPPKEDLQVPEDSPKATPEPPKKDKAPAYQYHYQHIDSPNNDSDSTSEESLPSTEILSSSEQTSSDSESQYADISGLLMATKIEDLSTSTPIAEESSDDNDNVQGSQIEPTPSVPPVSEKSSKPSFSPWFTFDDIPLHKWQARHQEFIAWIDVQMTSPNAQSHNVLREFCSRFTRSLRDWFESLGEYRQLQLIQTTIPIALTVIYEQFIGEPAASTEASRKKYHQMKCCSLIEMSEQYVTLEIPTDLKTNWKREGYTHLHLEGVRLILTLHGRKGLPVTAKIALLDTRFKEYQHVIISTVLTTLHAGEGYLVYPDKVNGHFLWDVPEAHMCNLDFPYLEDPYDDDEDFEIMRRRRRRKKKPSHPKTPCRSYSPEPPDDPSSSQPLPINKKALKWIEKENTKVIPQEPNPSPPKLRSCLMT